MLDLAIKHVSALQEEYQNTLLADKYRYFFNGTTIDYFLDIDGNSLDRLQMVSLDRHRDVAGYFSASFNRDINTAYEIVIINFRSKNPAFTCDLFDFFVLLFRDFGIERAVWNVVVGNPVESLYDRLAKNYGGRIVGTFRRAARLFDGQLYDLKWYEMYGNECLQAIRNKGVDGLTYRDWKVVR